MIDIDFVEINSINSPLDLSSRVKNNLFMASVYNIVSRTLVTQVKLKNSNISSYLQEISTLCLTENKSENCLVTAMRDVFSMVVGN